MVFIKIKDLSASKYIIKKVKKATHRLGEKICMQIIYLIRDLYPEHKRTFTIQ